MIEFEIWSVKLKARDEHIILGGTKQDKVRALFCAMLPDDGSCWQAAEVVKRALPHESQLNAYQEHRKALYDLANANDIRKTPDNVDESGNLLPGKRPGSFQRPKWNARSWQQIISDEIWQWVLDFMFDLHTREASAFILHGQKVRFFCNIQTFEIREMLDYKPEDDWGLWDSGDEELIAVHHKTTVNPFIVSSEEISRAYKELNAVFNRKYEEWKEYQKPIDRFQNLLNLENGNPYTISNDPSSRAMLNPKNLTAIFICVAAVFTIRLKRWPLIMMNMY